jgi:hypothetical protein
VNCAGATIQSDRDKRLRDAIHRMLKKNTEYRYDPEKPTNLPYFMNIITGDIIKDEKHKRLNKTITEIPTEEKYNAISRSIKEKREVVEDLVNDESEEIITIDK